MTPQHAAGRNGQSGPVPRSRAAETKVAPSARRARRAPGEISALILAAARESFAEKGYARSTTRDIAARADVAETLLFRNFGSKANLFGEAVLLPMAAFFREWVALIQPSTDPDTEQIQRGFIDDFHRNAVENRGLLMTLFATAVFEPAVLEGRGAVEEIQQAIDELADAATGRLRRLGVDVSGMNVALGARAVIGMILAMALFQDWLLPRGSRRPSRDDIVDELTRLVLYGSFNLRPQWPAVPAPVRPARRASPRRSRS